MGTVVRCEAPNGEVPRPLRPFVSLWKGAFSGAEKPPLQSANQPISRALRWSARVFVEKGAALPTVVRNRKFMQSHMLSCRGLCYSMDVSMSVSCSSSFLLSLHTEAPRRFARGLFHSSLKMMKENACNLCVTCRIIRVVLTFSYTDTQPHPATDIVRAGFSL